MQGEHEIFIWMLRLGIPFMAVMVGLIRYLETRFGRKQDKTACFTQLSIMDRLEVRLMRIENKFFEKPLSKEEVIKLVKKNNKINNLGD